MDHQLHAAGFVEEALGDDRVWRRQRAQGCRARADVCGGLLGARLVEPAFVQQKLAAGSVGGIDVLAQLATLRAKTRSVRPGASPRQNGIDGAAPWASSTRTRPGSTRRMRQDVVPSRNTSPAMLSTAKSSSSVPTTVPSGSATT